MERRRALTLLGASAGTLAGAGFFGRYALLAPPPSDEPASVRDLATNLYTSMDKSVRERVCVPYDHPLRQYHNRGVWCGGAEITPWSFTREQRGILNDLLHAGLSREGRGRIPEEYYTRWLGIQSMHVLICGDPAVGPYQVIISGPHLNLRLGGTNREGVAFGGPQIYGDQRGNYRQGLPGNLYQYQFQAGHRLFESLNPGQKQTALLEKTPIQTQIEVRGNHTPREGVAVAALSKDSRELVTRLISDFTVNYPPDDVAHAKACLAANGGIDALTLSYYKEGEVDGSGAYQIFRLEGPSAVFYFRGFPHVHAFINIAMNGEEPLSVGQVVGVNPEVLEGAQVKRLFEEAMRDQTRSDFAYYEEGSVVGRLRTGLIRSGDIYNLESWQEAVIVRELKGSDLPGALRDQARSEGVDPDPGRIYTVATTGSASRAEQPTLMLRDAAIVYLSKQWGGAPTAPVA